LLRLTAAFVAIAWASIASACDCKSPGSPTVERDRSSDIFVGRVYRITESGGRRTARFDVLGSWKGVRAESVLVQT